MKYRVENRFTGSVLYVSGENDENECSYDITGKSSLAKSFEEKDCSYENIHRLIGALQTEGRRLEAEGKDMNGWILDPNYIYYSDSDDIKFIFYPGETDIDIETGLKLLSEFVIEHVNYKDKDAVDIAYGFFLHIFRGLYVFDDLLQLSKRNING